MGKISIKLLQAVFTVDLLAFASGNFYSWSSTALIKLKNTDPGKNPLGRPVTYSEESLIASLLSLGAICGPLLAGICANALGRKNTILLFSLPMLASSLILTFATTTFEFYLARLMAGVGVGGVYTVVPMYIGEIAETNVRGFLGGVMGIFNVLGMLLGFAVGPFVDLKMFCFLQVIPTGLFLILWNSYVPESPFYHLIKEDEFAARRSLTYLRKSFDEKEMEMMRDTVNKSTSEHSLCVMFSSQGFRRALILTTLIMALQQLMGSIAILSYMEDIFAASGSSLSASTSTIIVALLQVCLVVLSTFLADRWGRKLLLMISVATCALSLFPLGLYFFIKYNEYDVSQLWFLPILCIVLFFVGFNFGLCTIPWTLVGELFTTEAKATASSITSITYFGMAFLMSFVFPHLKNFIGFHGVFWFCGSFSLAHLVFIYFFLPETKGKTFQEILDLMEKDKRSECFVNINRI
ncbi:facilitated trehalose transporter Tret1-like [Coccinella septempunctata]|uniref:facilitated trehalose transporter Tret1-like n=1 Tax=Coccinella septempunctata TaxID=41139 RepID=UPI001D080C5E|nr:facilitated trehalose transporter Tret1-like [Coccinella septempunctata]